MVTFKLAVKFFEAIYYNLGLSVRFEVIYIHFCMNCILHFFISLAVELPQNEQGSGIEGFISNVREAFLQQ